MKTPFPYQQAAVEAFCTRYNPPRLVFPFPTGAGKTFASILAMRRWCIPDDVTTKPRVLIVCPAPVRTNWKQELLDADFEEADIGVINCGPTAKLPSKPAEERRRQAYAAPIKIVSPELLKHCIEKYDFIILDEADMFRRSTSQQSKLAAALMAANETTPTVELTATQIPNDVKDLWHQLHLLWPGKWGRPSKPPYEGSFQFNNRYSLKRVSEYGTEWYGLNPDTADELRGKLARACHYVSREDVAPFLPARIVRRWEIPASADRVQAILDWCEDAMREGTHLSVQVYERKSARNLSNLLRKKFKRKTNVFTITGDNAPEARGQIREQWVSASRGILVSTMMSFGRGVSLTKADRALIAELWYVPGDLDQLMGRYARADKGVATPVDILVRAGSADERIAEIVIEKSKGIEQVTSGNQRGGELSAALETPVLEGEALAAMANSLLLSWNDEDEQLLEDS